MYSVFHSAWKLVSSLQKASITEYLLGRITGHRAWSHPLRGS